MIEKYAIYDCYDGYEEVIGVFSTRAEALREAKRYATEEVDWECKLKLVIYYKYGQEEEEPIKF